MAFGDHYTRIYVGRAADVFDYPGSGTGSPGAVYAQACHPCGASPTDRMRLVDLIPDPYYPSVDPDYPLEDPVATEPVYAEVPECSKDWVGAETYVAYDFFAGGAHTRNISSELRAQIEGLEDCSRDAKHCQQFTLYFDAGKNKWVGVINVGTGTLIVQILGTWDGVNEHWWVEFLGCTAFPPFYPPPVAPFESPIVNEFLMYCAQPLIGLAPTDQGVGSGCCGSPTFQPDDIKFWSLIPPVYAARLVDVTDAPGTGTGSPGPVYAAGECCDTDCPFNPGCCGGVAIDATLNYTVFNLVDAGAGCASPCDTPITVHATDASGCAVWTLGHGTDAGFCYHATLCLYCDDLASANAGQRGWQYYRLGVNDGGGEVRYSPSSGSCSPFSLTFDNIALSFSYLGLPCTGTYSVTITN